MNPIFETIVREHVPECRSARKISFVKFNTAGSPLRGQPKLLFFAFADSEQEPRACLKTVRSARDNGVISEGFGNLRALNELAGKERAALFPRALACGETDGIAWSVEGVAPGHLPRKGDIQYVLAAYTDFQRPLAALGRRVDTKTLGKEIIESLTLAPDERARTLAYWNELGLPSASTLLMPQHGDLTEDNILVEGTRVTLVDYDSFMREGPAGFDIFHLARRSPSTAARFSEYMRAYRAAIGEKAPYETGDLLLWYVQDLALKEMQSGRPSENIIESFAPIRAQFIL